LTLRDFGTVQSTLPVTDAGQVLDVNVQLNLTHTWDADLDVYLIGPDGTRVELFTDVGGSGDNFTNTILNDEVTTGIASGTAPFGGNFRPEGALGAFDGKFMAGTWTLEITDDQRGQKGKLNGWSLTIQHVASPSPLMARAPGTQRGTLHLTMADVQPVLSAARGRWQAAGADVSGLSHLAIHIADLGGTTLGLAAGRTIWLDDDAAGWGWFVDRTPGDDAEFRRPGDQGEQGRMDLLTVLMHEMGHLLGHEHDDHGVMQEALAPGMRSLPERHPVGRSTRAVPPAWDAVALALALDAELHRKR
jgi:subtilisin-like proprotein convertase family protein